MWRRYDDTAQQPPNTAQQPPAKKQALNKVSPDKAFYDMYKSKSRTAIAAGDLAAKVHKGQRFLIDRACKGAMVGFAVEK